MIDTQMFHIYDKETNRPVKVCMTTEELEQMLAEKSVDFEHWEVQPCYNICSSEEQSYWDEYKHLSFRGWRIPELLLL